jgi:hypothetical protein
MLDVVHGPSSVDDGQSGVRAYDREAPLITRDAGIAVLDAAAKVAYRRRVDELREELAEAESFNDPGRAERARDEIEALTEQLAGAVGLGSRDRTSADAAEHARLTIGKGIKRTLQRIAAAHPALGEHLAAGQDRDVLRLPRRHRTPDRMGAVELCSRAATSTRRRCQRLSARRGRDCARSGAGGAEPMRVSWRVLDEVLPGVSPRGAPPRWSCAAAASRRSGDARPATCSRCAGPARYGRT